MNNYFKQLALPFEPEHVTFKPGTVKGDKCMALAYGDLRAYLNRLDEVCGPDWSVTYEPWGESRIIARLTIGGITRCSTGEMGSADVKSEMGGTVAEAQAFKRACAMFGLGRSLYEMPTLWVDFDKERRRITDAGYAQLAARYRTWYDKEMATLCPWLAWTSPSDAYKWAIKEGYVTCEEHATHALKKVVDENFGGSIKQSNWPMVAEAYYHNRLSRQEEKTGSINN